MNGFDLAVDFLANDSWMFAGTFSWVSDEVFTDILSSNSTPLMLNSPATKGSVAVKYRNEPRGWSFEVRSRFNEAFPVNSGVYAAGENALGNPITFTRPGSTTVYSYEGVEGATVFDMGITYRLPFAGAREALISLNGTNVFDKGYRTMPGAPLIGRMFVTRLQYSF